MTIEKPHPHIAVIGAGPAGIYAAGFASGLDPAMRIDLFEKLPAPYGLVRYGVSPDHPRIKAIIDSLHPMLANPRVRLFCNVQIGSDISIDELREAYDAVIVATGANHDVPLYIPGVDLAGSHGSAEFVSWYDSHPDVPLRWDLDATDVAVLGAGNVALDVARMLVLPPSQLETTDVSDNVMTAFQRNAARDVHIFARRGPVDARFSADELRELDEIVGLQVIVKPEDVHRDEYVERVIRQFTANRHVFETLESWAHRDPKQVRDVERRIHLHFFEAPVEVLGSTRVEGVRTARTAANHLGHYASTGITTDHRVQSVYRAIGYASEPIDGLPFDATSRTIPHHTGAVLGPDSSPLPGVFVTGWIKRGCVGLIGSTKSDARQSVQTMMNSLGSCPSRAAGAIDRLLSRLHAQSIDIAGWYRIDEAEQDAGRVRGRVRTKIVDRDDLVRIGLGHVHVLAGIAQDVGQSGDDVVEQRGVADQRRRDLQHRIATVVAAGDEPRLAQPSRQERAQQLVSLGLVEPGSVGVLDQLHSPEESGAPHIADDRQIEQPQQPVAQTICLRANVLQHVLPLHDLDVAQRDRGAEGMSAERDAVTEHPTAVDQRRQHVAPHEHRTHRGIGRRQSLGDADQVRCHGFA